MKTKYLFLLIILFTYNHLFAQLKLSKGWIYSDFFIKKNGALYSAKKIVYKNSSSKKTIKWDKDYALRSFKANYYQKGKKNKIRSKYEYDKKRNLLKWKHFNTNNTWEEGQILKRNKDTLLTISYSIDRDTLLLKFAGIETINQSNISRTIILYTNKHSTKAPNYITDLNQISTDNVRTLFNQGFFSCVDSTVWFYDKTLKPIKQMNTSWEKGYSKDNLLPKESQVIFNNDYTFHLDNIDKLYYYVENQDIFYHIPSLLRGSLYNYDFSPNKTPYIKWDKKGNWIKYKEKDINETRKIQYWK